MTEIPDDHPRADSLRRRERIVAGVRGGLTSEAGLVAHGRGEAFDYLLGERTRTFARTAIDAAAARLLTARHPVFSVNGNVAALAVEGLVQVAQAFPRMRFEVNLFHYHVDRITRIVQHLEQHGLRDVMGADESRLVDLPGLQSARRKMDRDGIDKADVVIVPLEDGDRCGALVESGREVITVDLNPLSRTARTATITIVDELTRALDALADQLRRDTANGLESLAERVRSYDNSAVLADAEAALRHGTSESGTSPHATQPPLT